MINGREITLALLIGFIHLGVDNNCRTQNIGSFGNKQADSLLVQGRILQERGNFLRAARIFRTVWLHSDDSVKQAEALYRFVSCGNSEAAIINSSGSTTNLKAFRTLGFNIVFLEWNRTWVNADTSIRKLLASEYPHTEWGAAAAFDLIHGEVFPDGMWKVDHPRVVLQRGKEFLRQYPHSKYQFDAEHLLALALQDLWNMVNENDKEFLTPEELTQGESYRMEAIAYLEDVSRHRNELRKEKWKRIDDSILNCLRKHQDTGIGFFLIVD